MRKLFVGNLPDGTTEESLQNVFSRFGTVRACKIMRDVFSGWGKGFGFIEMEGHEARVAIANLNGKEFNGNVLKVNFEFSKSRCRRR